MHGLKRLVSIPANGLCTNFSQRQVNRVPKTGVNTSTGTLYKTQIDRQGPGSRPVSIPVACEPKDENFSAKHERKKSEDKQKL